MIQALIIAIALASVSFYSYAEAQPLSAEDRERLKDELHQMITERNVDIHFLGKVIDQYGESVPNAKVNMSLGYYMPILHQSQFMPSRIVRAFLNSITLGVLISQSETLSQTDMLSKEHIKFTKSSSIGVNWKRIDMSQTLRSQYHFKFEKGISQPFCYGARLQGALEGMG